MYLPEQISQLPLSGIGIISVLCPFLHGIISINKLLLNKIIIFYINYPSTSLKYNRDTYIQYIWYI